MDTKLAQGTLQGTTSPPLYLAFELNQKQWKLGFTIGVSQRPRIRTIQARDLPAVQWEIQEAHRRFRLPDKVTILSCYEAGRDGFWLDRYLHAQGIANLVVDSASIEVSRRSKRAKTDKLDVDKLLEMLIRYHSGERKLWRVVQVPRLEVEDQRQLHRELATLKTEHTRHINRIKGLLVGQGVPIPMTADLLERLYTVHLWDGSGLPAGLHTRLERCKPKSKAIFAIIRCLLIAVFHVLSERAADKYAIPEMMAFKLMVWSWKLADQERGGLSSRQFSEVFLMFKTLKPSHYYLLALQFIGGYYLVWFHLLHQRLFPPQPGRRALADE